MKIGFNTADKTPEELAKDMIVYSGPTVSSIEGAFKDNVNKTNFQKALSIIKADMLKAAELNNEAIRQMSNWTYWKVLLNLNKGYHSIPSQKDEMLMLIDRYQNKRNYSQSNKSLINFSRTVKKYFSDDTETSKKRWFLKSMIIPKTTGYKLIGKILGFSKPDKKIVDSAMRNANSLIKNYMLNLDLKDFTYDKNANVWIKKGVGKDIYIHPTACTIIYYENGHIKQTASWYMDDHEEESFDKLSGYLKNGVPEFKRVEGKNHISFLKGMKLFTDAQIEKIMELYQKIKSDEELDEKDKDSVEGEIADILDFMDYDAGVSDIMSREERKKIHDDANRDWHEIYDKHNSHDNENRMRQACGMNTDYLDKLDQEDTFEASMLIKEELNKNRDCLQKQYQLNDELMEKEFDESSNIQLDRDTPQFLTKNPENEIKEIIYKHSPVDKDVESALKKYDHDGNNYLEEQGVYIDYRDGVLDFYADPDDKDPTETIQFTSPEDLLNYLRQNYGEYPEDSDSPDQNFSRCVRKAFHE